MNSCYDLELVINWMSDLSASVVLINSCYVILDKDEDVGQVSRSVEAWLGACDGNVMAAEKAINHRHIPCSLDIKVAKQVLWLSAIVLRQSLSLQHPGVYFQVVTHVAEDEDAIITFYHSSETAR